MKKLCIIKLEKEKHKVCCQEQNKPFVLGKSRMVYFFIAYVVNRWQHTPLILIFYTQDYTTHFTKKQYQKPNFYKNIAIKPSEKHHRCYEQTPNPQNNLNSQDVSPMSQNASKGTVPFDAF